MARLFTGDFSTGDFKQWERLLTVQRIAITQHYPQKSLYPATIISEDPDCGYTARFEVRNGDVASGDSGDRSEVTGDARTYAAAGTTRWYAFSVKYDSTFPVVQDPSSFSGVIQWKSASIGPYNEYGVPVIGMGPLPTDPGDAAGYWYVFYSPQSAPFSGSGGGTVMRLPLDLGKWQDIKVRAFWSKTAGTLEVWRNGVKQTFNGGTATAPYTVSGDGKTFTGALIINSAESTGVINHKGIYRKTETHSTEIVYMRNFRMADTESSL